MKTNMKQVLLIGGVLFGLGSCAASVSSVRDTSAVTAAPVNAAAVNTAPVNAAHNSRNSVNWEGVYLGVIPAADGPGITVRIILYGDETYEISYEYTGRPGRFIVAGSFRWDESGGVITLDDPDDLPPYYRVGEDQLILLDREGEPITGDLAEHAVLRKAGR